MPSFCWKCGKKLALATVGKNKGKVVVTTRNYHDVEITLHKYCAKSLDKEEAEDKFNWLKPFGN